MAAPPITRSRRTAEPILWLLFSAGGVAAALFLPLGTYRYPKGME